MDIDSLPIRLDYLRPVLQHLADSPLTKTSEAIEDIQPDVTVLERVMLDRVGSLSLREAEEVIRTDRAELGDWLSKTKNCDPKLQFILAWMMMGATQVIGIKEDNLAFLSKTLEDLPKAPPGRDFGPLPNIKPVESELLSEDGNLTLYIQKNGFGPPKVVDIRVEIDGKVVLHNLFEDSLEKPYTRYRIQLPQGTHQIVITSEIAAARLEEEFSIKGMLYACILFLYAEPSAFHDEEAPRFFFQTKKKDWVGSNWKAPQ